MNDSPTPLGKSVADRVAAELIDMIAGGDWAPGQRLPGERALAEQMNVSRVSVRAALQRLKTQGFVVAVQGGGTSVVSSAAAMDDALTELVRSKLDNLHDLAEIRMALETWAARRAAERATPEQIAEIAERLAAMESAGPRSRAGADKATEDVRFHFAVGKAAGSPVYTHILTVIRDILMQMLEFHRYKLFTSPEDDRAVMDQHQDIYDSIAGHRPDAAAEALTALQAAATDTKVALVPGGPHPYFAAWEQAGSDAAQKFGLAGADYRVPQAWELSLQNELIESLVAQGYNGFLVFPGDAVGTSSTLSELSEFGIQSIALAGCLKDPNPAVFCMGTDVYNSAYLGTKELIDAMGGQGSIAHFTGFLVDPNTQLRIEAVEKAVAEAGGSVDIIQVIADIDAPEPADEKINAFLAAQGNEVDGIVTTAWVPAVVAATSLRNLGDRRIKMVGIDHDQVVLDAIGDGFVHGTMLQNPYGQGYIGSFVIDKLRQGCTVRADAPFEQTAQTAKFIDSGTAFVDAGDVANYQDAMVRVTDEIMATFEETYLSCP